MNINDIKTVAMIGAGDMGHGIAEVALLAGYRVNLYDIEEEFVEKGKVRIFQSLDLLRGKGGSDSLAGGDGDDRLVPGPGDDAAVLQPPAGSSVLVSCDMSVEDVHFRRAWLTWEEIGHQRGTLRCAIAPPEFHA